LSAGFGGRVGTATHDRDRDVLARGRGEFLDIESRSGLVIAEEQVPGLLVRLDPLALQGRRQVEHHHVRLVMSENGGTTCRRTASAQVSRRALIRVPSALAHSDMAWLLVYSEDERSAMNPHGRAVVRLDVGAKKDRFCRRVGGEARCPETASRRLSSAQALGKSTYRREMHPAFSPFRQLIEVANIFSHHPRLALKSLTLSARRTVRNCFANLVLSHPSRWV
jgi:hypothetical protein